MNLFNNVTKISTRFCFRYNDAVFFCVPKDLVSKAIGENGRNSKQLNRILDKKIKIIASPNGVQDAKEFIESIINPVELKGVEFNDNEVIIHAGSKNKAALIGREKRRLLEMRKIMRDFFGKEVRIV